MSEVRLVDVGKRYEGSTAERPALEKLNLTIPSGELAVLVGPSGCGKSTTLRIVAGLESPTRGKVYIDDREVTHVPPSQRDIAMVFQSYALYPHMTVFDNMSFALRIRKMPSAQIRDKVTAVARSLGIEDYLDRRPKALSGGQRQRVAIGRAVVRDPKVFLFDEPLSNLDAKLRGEMRREIARIHHASNATSLYVTHDQVEAMTLADRIVVLRDGHIQQVGTPIDIYDTPANQFVAGFFGTPAMNFLPAAAAGIHRDNLIVGVRPEAITLHESPGAASLSAAVEQREVLGAEVLLHLTSDVGELTVRTDAHAPARRGDNVTVWLDSNSVHLFDATSEQRLESGPAL